MYKFALIFLCLMLMTQICIAQDSKNASPLIGRWDLTVQGADAEYTSWLEVTKNPDGALSGRFVGRFGSARPIKQIAFSDGELNFSLPPQFEQMKVDLVFKGTLKGEKLSGTTNGEDGRTLNWSGVPAPALKPGKNVKWGQPVELFNGRDLTGWKVRFPRGEGCWTVEDGAMTNSKGCVDLITERKFMDFKLTLELKLADPAMNGGQPSNSGIYLRGRHEVQVLDDYGKPPESHGMGSVYGFLTPTKNAARKAGEWQSYEITLIGRQLTVVLNGETIIDRQEIPGITGGALDSNEGAPGPIMLQGDHGKVWYRNIMLVVKSRK
ncbi:MAG: DUF1080 domain-containing protein [Acidobacteriota bacterium]|nr:MAG: DUF1080 domain-containing protein [Acidobacteriota bacterium]